MFGAFTMDPWHSVGTVYIWLRGGRWLLGVNLQTEGVLCLQAVDIRGPHAKYCLLVVSSRISPASAG